MNRESLFLGTLLVVALVATGVLFSSYLSTILVAAVLAMASYGGYERIEKKLKSPWLSALLMGVLAIGFIFVPLGYLVFQSIAFASSVDVGLIQSRLKEVMELGESLLAKVPGIEDQVASWVQSVDIPKLSRTIFGFVGVITTKGANFVMDAFFILLFYLCFLVYGVRMSEFVFATLPLSVSHRKVLVHETLMSIRSLFYALFITAFLQGAIFAILMVFYGMDALFWGLLYGIASMVPVVGGALVWIPLSVYAWLNISPIAAAVIALYSIIILGTLVDNFARPVVVGWVNKHLLQNHQGMHEILVFFAMIAGIGAVGFFGIILGPTIVALTIVLMKLVQQNSLTCKGD
jgi:predicted PurR-regulated permease PerM